MGSTRVLVVGAGGQLGHDLLRLAALRRGSVGAAECVGLTEAELDVTDREAVRMALAQHRPAVVINAAAYTDVERAEDEPEAAGRVNADAAGIVSGEAARVGAAVVYVSTDFVFDGMAREPYEPDAAIRPLNVYGRTKADGESRTRQSNARHFVVRTAWLYGPGGNNFVEKILSLAASRPKLRIVQDEVGSPTHTFDLAGALLALSETQAWGTYHCVNAGSCSRHAFAREFLALAGAATPIEPCSAAEMTTKARRPSYSVLSNARIEEAAGLRMRTWQEALAHYMRRR